MFTNIIMKDSKKITHVQILLLLYVLSSQFCKEVLIVIIHCSQDMPLSGLLKCNYTEKHFKFSFYGILLEWGRNSPLTQAFHSSYLAELAVVTTGIANNTRMVMF